jgi:hypothetical protein
LGLLATSTLERPPFLSLPLRPDGGLTALSEVGGGAAVMLLLAKSPSWRGKRETTTQRPDCSACQDELFVSNPFDGTGNGEHALAFLGLHVSNPRKVPITFSRDLHKI